MIREDFLKNTQTTEIGLDQLQVLLRLIAHRNELVKAMRLVREEELKFVLHSMEVINNQIKTYLNL